MQILSKPEVSQRFSLRPDGKSIGSLKCFIECNTTLLLDTARASKFPLPLSATAHPMFMQASSAGVGREDDSAVFKIVSGITRPEKK